MKASGREGNPLALRARLGLAASLAILSSAFVISPVAAVLGNDSTVLILGSTVSGGASSREATAAVALGFSVEVVSNGTWAEMTADEFGSYRAIVLGDATCGGSTSTFTANEETWGPEVDGNVVLIGTDPIFHQSQGGGTLTDKGIAFAVDQAGKTGLYATLSCYYHATAPSTPVPAFDSLSGAGDFTVTGVGCYNDAHIVAAHPALAGLTDEDLSDWSCSVHEAFDSWPSDFQVLAIAEGVGNYRAADGSTGTPYILARGEGLVPIGGGVSVQIPRIAITKGASATTVSPGGSVTYSYAVTNTSFDALLFGVTVSDDKCAPVTFTGGDADHDGNLQTTETWTYSCITTLASTTTNVATATGHWRSQTVSATASATVTVGTSQVLAETSRPQISLPPTSTAKEAGAGTAGPSLGLILLILGAIGVLAGFVAPARIRTRR